jgi:hypothetical protein
MNLGKFAVNKYRETDTRRLRGSDMKQFCGAVALGAVLIGSAICGPAMAAPPTVVPSPGYDARLQEQRAALRAAETPKPAYVPRRKSRPHHGVPR